MMRIKRSWLAVIVVVVVVVTLAQRQFGTHNAPAGQPPLVHLEPDTVTALHSDFNAARDAVRLIVLLSPT